jgi:hypothetical protein
MRRPLALILLMLTSVTTATIALAADQEFFVYFGTYTKAPSKGIYRSRFDVTTGRLSPAELAAETKDPRLSRGPS